MDSKRALKKGKSLLFLSFSSHLFVLLGAQTSMPIGEDDAQLLGPLHNLLALLAAHCMANFGAVLFVLHEEDV